MLPLVFSSPGSVKRQIARRVVASRLALGWTRAELAERSGIAIDTLKRFEQTGQVSLERLLKIAVALDALREFNALFPERDATSLDELETQVAARGRVRARGRRQQPTASTETTAPATTGAGMANVVAKSVTPTVPNREGENAAH